MRTIETTWEVWTYDVWGNARDGYEVNDRYCHDRNYKVTLTVETFNPNTPQAFDGASLTDEQIREVFSLHGNVQIDTDGDDLTVYVNRSRDGYPIGELICTSHKSLSPVRKS